MGQVPSRPSTSPSLGVGGGVPTYLHFEGPSRGPQGDSGCLGRGWFFGDLGWDMGREALDHLAGPNHGP